jgi:hypothetical protein
MLSPSSIPWPATFDGVPYASIGEPSIEQRTRELIAAKALKLATDWMRSNPGRGTPRILIVWPEPSAEQSVVHLIVDEHCTGHLEWGPEVRP